jgi:signal transduction histidine kinase/CheY-like chemotaxis protein
VRLRTQILIFLLVFALTPLLAAVVINLPLVFGSLELFYQKAHLQNLRADFRDLDEHLASRQEMVRLLAKLPEPGAILGEADNTKKIDLARARYTQWINQILPDQLDVVQISFLDDFGQERFWLERDRNTQEWRPTTRMPDRPPEGFLRAAARLEPGGVLVSHIRLNPKLGVRDSRRLMSLYLISPVVAHVEGRRDPMGWVVMSVDVGGIAKFYRNTLWVNNNGSYLGSSGGTGSKGQAFRDYPGLERIFANGTLDLWKGPNDQQILWVPLFLTEDSGPLWVGRKVDPSPLAAFRNALTLRVLLIVFLLVVMVLVVARWIALRVERFGEELTRGIGRMLKEDEAVAFSWRGSQEVQALGHDLTALARTHAEHAHSLREHARQLEESNRYKSEFLANVSHELRTPLNSILLLSKLLADGDSGLSLEQAKQARVIHRAGRDLQTLIDNILDHSRIEAHEITLYLEWLDPRVLVEQLMELVQPQFEQKGLYLRLIVDPGAPPQVRSDRDKLSQILKNFLSNAVKFTEEGGVEIRVSAAGRSGCPLRIDVRDTGIGIPAEKHALVFEAFKQADGSTSRRYGGTGLGLSISHELASLLGGLIELASVPGEGSTFSLLLPLDLENPDARSLPVPASLAGGRPPPLPVAAPERHADLSGHCVLLVERDVSALLQITPLLERLGLKVLAAADREEALECLREEEPCSLILLDTGMPEQDGCATIRGMRSEPRCAGLPIITIDDGDDPAYAARCRTAGVTEVLPRPLDPARLETVLVQQLGGTGPEDPRTVP